MSHTISLFLCVVVLAFSLPVRADRITFDDLYGMPSLNDPQISPDGRSIAYTRGTLHGSSIWRVDLGDALAGGGG